MQWIRSTLPLLALLAPAFAQEPTLSGVAPRLVENRGQWHPDVRFRARSGSTFTWLTNRGLTFALDAYRLVEPQDESGCGRPFPERVGGASVRMLLDGGPGEQFAAFGSGEVGAKAHFYRGARDEWVRDAKSFDRVIYRDAFPGVDMTVHGQGESVAYQLGLAADAPLDRVVFRIEGADGVRIAPDGRLVIDTHIGTVTQSAPIAWHVTETGDREPIGCQFRLLDGERFGFSLNAPRQPLPLVIDPGIAWSAVVGGSNQDLVHAQSVDDITGRIFACGETLSADYPTTTGPGFASSRMGFVTLLDPSLAQPHAWSAYLGGSSYAWATDLVAEPGGQQVAVVGLTRDVDFPTTPGAVHPTNQGNLDGFAMLMDGNANPLSSTYLGANGADWATTVASAGGGQFVVGGTTGSSTLVTTPGVVRPTNAAGLDQFLIRWDPMASGAAQRVWATYLGGSGQEGFYGLNRSYDMGIFDIDIDAAGSIYASGRTLSADFPVTAGAFQSTRQGTTGGDVFVTVLDATASRYVYSSYLGSTRDDGTESVRAHPLGGVLIAGFAWERVPTTTGAYDTGYQGRNDALLAWIDPLQSGAASLRYCSQVGGPDSDAWFDVDVSSSGICVATGWTLNGGVAATPGAFLATGSTFFQATLARIHPRGNGMADLYYLTYLGSGGTPTYSGTGGVSVHVRPGGSATVAVITDDAAYPTSTGVIGVAGGGDWAATTMDLLPNGVSSGAVGTPGCGEPCYGGVNGWPQSGSASFAVNTTGAPPGAAGTYLIGTPTLSPLLNVNVLVAGSTGPLVQADAAGFAEAAIPIPAQFGPGSSASLQWLFLTNAACPGTGPVAASDRIDLVVQ